jgi:hypothetical protein
MGSINPADDTDDVAAESVSEGSRGWSSSDDADRLSVSSRQRIRSQMQADIDAFLARGGKIQQLDISMSAEKLNPN